MEFQPILFDKARAEGGAADFAVLLVGMVGRQASSPTARVAASLGWRPDEAAARQAEGGFRPDAIVALTNAKRT